MAGTGTWASLFADTDPAKRATTVHMRDVRLEWYCEAEEDNIKFIEDTCSSLGYDFECDFINIRADVHPTKSVWAQPAPTAAATAPQGRTNGHFSRKVPHPRPVKTIMPAAWHITLELHSMRVGTWTNVHVYCDTKEVKVDEHTTVGIATGAWSEVNGKDILANPELFPPQRYSSVKSGYVTTTYVSVPNGGVAHSLPSAFGQ